MAQKLWEKSVRVNEDIDRFTVGRDWQNMMFWGLWLISRCWRVSVC